MRLTAPDESFPAEVAALRFWAGRGTVLLVETDLGAGTMLLERLDLTRSVATLPLAEANHHAGRMMRRLAVPAPSWVLSTGELVRDRLATLKSDWVALGRPVPARNAGRCLYRRRDPDLRHRRPQSSDGLSPRLGTCVVEQREALLLQLVRCGLDGLRISDLELDARLWHRPLRWPVRRAEARLRSLSQGQTPKDLQPSMSSLCR